MLKQILNLKSVSSLSKQQQRKINGGSVVAGCNAISKQVCTHGCKELNASGQWVCSTCCIASDGINVQ